MYFDEDLILDIRLNTLNKYVDQFIIAEATMDHAGNEKKLNFDIKKFTKFKDKINYLTIEDLPQNVGSFKKDWHPAHARDQFQRNSLERGYKNFHDEDLIMISDIDEIPNPKKIVEFEIKNKYACFIQKNYHQKLNLLNITIGDWPGTKICQKKNLKNPQWLRDIKTNKKFFWKILGKKNPQLIYNGGWHFNDLKTPEDLLKKIKSGAHQELNKPEIANLEKIKFRLDNKIDLRGRKYLYEKKKLDLSFPEYVYKNQEKFKSWIA